MEKLSKVLIFAEKESQFGLLCSAAKSIAEHTAAFAVASAPACPVDKAFVVADQGIVFDDYFETFAAVTAEYAPDAIIVSSEKRMCSIAARIAAVCKTAVIADVNAMEVAEGKLYCSHLVYGGAAVRCESSAADTTVVVLAPGSFEDLKGEAAEKESVDFAAPAHPAKFVERREKQGETVNLSAAKRAVGIGRGLAKQEDLEMVYAFAAKLGAEVGCSRPIAQGENWMAISRYIGVSGVMLKPDIYVALGISGQVQHTVGVRDAKIIIAVNKDKNAPIFKQCDYGIVVDMYKVVPALTGLL